MTCIYCQSQKATTRDHVPPKELLRKPYPRNLLTVPSCAECNESYSVDEEYFRLTIVGLLCHTPEAESLFDGPLSRSMNRRPSLEDLMFGSLSPHADGVVLDVDYARIYRVGNKIAQGLCFAVSGLLPATQTVLLNRVWGSRSYEFHSNIWPRLHLCHSRLICASIGIYSVWIGSL